MSIIKHNPYPATLTRVTRTKERESRPAQIAPHKKNKKNQSTAMAMTVSMSKPNQVP